MNLLKFKKALGAGFFGQLVSVIIQISSLPLYLNYWSIDKYGVWLMLSAIPAYLSLADGGVAATVGNKITILISQGKEKDAQELFSKALSLTFLLSIVTAACSFCALFFIDGKSIVFENASTLFALCMVVILTIFSGMIDASCKAVDKYELGIYLINIIRIFEWAAGVFSLILFGEFIYVAIGMFFGRLVGTIISVSYVINKIKIIKWRFMSLNKKEAKIMLSESIKYMSFSIGNAILLQGSIIVIGFMYGAAVVATYTAYRTISRIITQLLTLVSRSMWNEITIMYAKNEINKLNILVRKTIKITFLLSVTVMVFSIVFGEFIINIWAKSEIAYNNYWMIFMLMSAVITSLWQIKMVALLATNNHTNFYIVNLVLSVMFVFFAAMSPVGDVMFYLSVQHVVFEILMMIACGFFYRKVFSND